MIGFYANICMHDVLSNNELIDLYNIISNGSEEEVKIAKEKIFNSNIKLVSLIALKYKNNSFGLEPDDLFQMGSIGLINAIDSYDVNAGYRFSTYASKIISNFILNDFKYLSRKQRNFSYDYYMDEDESFDFVDKTSDFVTQIDELYLEEDRKKDAKLVLDEVTSLLTDKEKDIIMSRVNGKKLREIAELYKCSAENIRLLEVKTKKKIRTDSVSSFFKTYS